MSVYLGLLGLDISTKLGLLPLYPRIVVFFFRHTTVPEGRDRGFLGCLPIASHILPLGSLSSIIIYSICAVSTSTTSIRFDLSGLVESAV